MFLSETEFVRWLQSRTRKPSGGVRLGIGDDAAVVRLARGHEMILTADLSIEGVHFLPRLHPPQSAGHRALARSLSDIAAMGGVPRVALISLALSQSVSRAWVEKFYAGVFALAKRFNVEVIGGDTAVVRSKTFADVTVAGEIPAGREVRRSKARPGDQIFVSGRLGLSALGLKLLRSGRASRHEGALAVNAHLYPEPRCALGRYLSGRRLATAMIDLSDGLSPDLARLCDASGVGARIFRDHIPRLRARPELGLREEALLELALNGGEDYELLFTVPKSKASRIPPSFRGLALARIGEIRPPKKLLLVSADGELFPLRCAGYDHFRRT